MRARLRRAHALDGDIHNNSCNGWDLMMTSRFQYSVRGARRFTRLLLSPALAFVLLQGCTNLDESPTSVIVPDNFFQTEAEVLGSLASVYAVLRSAANAYLQVSNISSDESIVPTRGSDWFDNGKWLELQRHTWTANSPLGLQEINGIWNDAFKGIARANLLLDALQDLTVANQAAIIAELRTLRAFYYYELLDMFGGVPLVEDVEPVARAKATRAEVYHFVVDELIVARADLPDSWPPADHGRMTTGAADAILASTYLNAGVFTTDAPSVAGYNSCTTVPGACDGAIAAADRILNSGEYSLATDWRSNFEPDNDASPENILVVKYIAQDGLGLVFLMQVLHYNMYTPSPWNGFAALAQTYNAFDADDERREIFLEGPQSHIDTGEDVCERPANSAASCAAGGTRLVFTVDIIDETQAGEGEGTRMMKWPPDPARVGTQAGNDVAFFRLAGIYLIKAEAQLELGTGDPLGILNMLRARVFDPDEPRTTVDRDAILEERMFELTNEAKRRQDLIRHGKFTAAWQFKAAGARHLVLMPIPQTQLDANPLLKQNPGYAN